MCVLFLALKVYEVLLLHYSLIGSVLHGVYAVRPAQGETCSLVTKSPIQTLA